jgi:hypothetical protein
LVDFALPAVLVIFVVWPFCSTGVSHFIVKDSVYQQFLKQCWLKANEEKIRLIAKDFDCF